MIEPRISVVIPCYNGAKYLPDCIASVLAQQTDCEIIVVDDGSTDDSLAVTRSLRQSCPMPLIAISQANAGPATARNLGLRAASCQYICFLDVDDLYKPGFFRLALQALDANAKAVAIFCQIEIIGTDRPVQDWQRRETELCLPGNIIARTDVVRQMGGFPTHKAFRGRAAGEDIAFRWQLHTFGRVLMVHECYFLYRVTDGNHFLFFLDRSSLEDGKIVIANRTPEELDGSWDAAYDDYRSQIKRRIADEAAAKLKECIASTQNYAHLAPLFQSQPEILHPYEGYVLYTLARYWPVVGRVVEVGNCCGQSTCWLAAACKESGRNPVATVDADAASLPILQSTLAAFALGEHAIIHSGISADVAASWSDSIRLLLIDADHSNDSAQSDFSLWQRHLDRNGLVAFHGIGTQPAVTNFFESLQTRQKQWRLFGLFNSLGVLERIGNP